MSHRFLIKLIISSYFVLNPVLSQAQPKAVLGNQAEFTAMTLNSDFDSKLAELKQRYPNAEIRFISEEQVKALEQDEHIFLAGDIPTHAVTNPQYRVQFLS